MIKMMRTKTKLILVMWAALLLTMVSCDMATKKKSKDYLKVNPNLREIVVNEVLQTSSYTYLKFEENGESHWGAIPRRDDIQVGGTYYFDSFMEMENFPSKELDRTFERIWFITAVSDKPFAAQNMMPATPATAGQKQQTGSSKVGEKEIKPVEAAEGGITIGELYANRDKYNGKVVKIRGKVVKYTAAVMKKNWAHIQDGSRSGNNFDLTVTTTGTCAEGDIVTFEGKITLNKDFGYGYAYDVLMEDADILEIVHDH